MSLSAGWSQEAVLTGVRLYGPSLNFGFQIWKNERRCYSLGVRGSRFI
jgi:hypothetical protein